MNVEERCRKGDLEALQMLVGRGVYTIGDAVDPESSGYEYDMKKKEVIDSSRSSCLFYAVRGGYVEMVDWLVQNGEDLGALTNCGDDVTFLAARVGQVEMLEFLFGLGIAITRLDSKNRNLWHLAAYKNRVDVMEVLLERGLPMNETSSSWWAPLHYACFVGQLDAARFLIEHECSCTQRSKSGWTALHLAAEYKSSEELIEVVVNAGCPIDDCSTNGSTALFYAVDAGLIGNVEMLLSLGADPLIGTGSKLPLASALYSEKIGIAKLLLEYMSPSKSVIKSRYLVMVVQRNPNTEKLLESYGVKVVGL